MVINLFFYQPLNVIPSIKKDKKECARVRGECVEWVKTNKVQNNELKLNAWRWQKKWMQFIVRYLFPLSPLA